MNLLRLFLLLLFVVQIYTYKGYIGHQLVKLQKKVPTSSKTKKPLTFWLANGCRDLQLLHHKKSLTMKHVEQNIKKIQRSRKKTKEGRIQMEMFGVFMKELNETEVMMAQSLLWLDMVLRGDYKDMFNMKESSRLRLEALRNATLNEQQEYNAVVDAQGRMSGRNHTQMTGMIDDILKEVSHAADLLEKNLDDHVFDTAIHNLAKGGNIETVIKIGGGAMAGGKRNQGEEHTLKLVDSKDNQFVLARGEDSTIPTEDHNLIKDVLYVMLMSYASCWVCSLFKVPTMFGYVVGGIILGPSGANVLQSLVQVETLGEFGVFFILFAVGLDFSPSQLKKVMKVALLGTSLMTCVMLLVGAGMAWLLQTSVTECSFVAACLSLSSTPLVIRFLQPHSTPRLPDSGGDVGYDVILMGILVMQDVFLGVIMAVLPNISGQTVAAASQRLTTVYLLLVIRLVITLVAVLLLCYLLGKFLIGRFYRHIIRIGSTELTVLATIVIMFSMVLLTSSLGVSMELGCFLAGVVISAQGHKLAEHIERLLEPLQHFLSCFFFTSIGLHVFPQFLVYELTTLMTFTMATVAVKYVICVSVLALVLRQGPWRVKWIVSAGLAQVSEFAFVLGSRARRLDLISREVYLLILGVTTLSLVFAPVLWKATLWYLRLKPAHDSPVSTHSVTSHIDSDTDDLMSDMHCSTQAIGHSTQVTGRNTQVTGHNTQDVDYTGYDLGLGGRS